jgi:hypothetical protein
MQWASWTAINLYFVVGCVVLFRRLRRRGGPPLIAGDMGRSWR